MPWFPDFANAAELARRSVRADAEEDPIGQYLAALDRGETGALEDAWPVHVTVDDPRAGHVRGHWSLRRFVHRSESWLAEHHAEVGTRASIEVDGRAVVELMVRLAEPDGRDRAWPVAVVAESDGSRSMTFRTYCSQMVVDGRRHVRPPILAPADEPPGDVVGRHLAALEVGDVDAVVRTFAADGSVQEAVGAPTVHRGAAELRDYYEHCAAAGGLAWQPCRVTDDGVRCAVEYTCLTWAGRPVPPQAGLAVFERAGSGHISAVHLYDDIEGATTP